MGKAIVVLAEGFELCEALLVVDILQRAKAEVTKVAIGDSLQVRCSGGTVVLADVTEKDADFASADMLILPGGMPGSTNLYGSETVRQQCIEFASRKKLAAICAAPAVVLSELGLLEGKKATVYPSFEDKMNCARVTRKGVTVDGNITTGQALGSAIPFALELAEQLQGKEAARRVSNSICF